MPTQEQQPSQICKTGLCWSEIKPARERQRERERGERDGEKEASVDRHSSLCSAGIEHLIMECLSGSGHVLVYGYRETCGGIKAAA